MKMGLLEPGHLDADRLRRRRCWPSAATTRRACVRWLALVGAVVSFLVTLPLYARFDSRHLGDAVRREGALDRPLQRQLPPGHRRHVVLVRAADRLHHGGGGDLGLGSDHRARQPVHGRLPDPVGPDDRRVLRARRRAVLRVLRGHADPDVPDHRHLGRPEQDLRGLQVLPVHAARLAADAGRAGLPVHQVGRQLRHPDLAQAAAVGAGADPAVLRLLRGLRGQGADVAGAHLAARRARRGAHRRLRRAGRHHAEAGRLRLPALLACRSRPTPRANGPG